MRNSNINLNSKISNDTDVSKPWDKGNQAWWDWYISLADNDVKEDEIINVDPLPDIAIPTDAVSYTHLTLPTNREV